MLTNEYIEEAVNTDGPVCPTCGQTGDGKFCAKCGEQIQLKPDYSLRGLVAETLNIVTNLESNIFRSFGLLIAKPGFLTAEYFAGRRKRYLKPLQLFIFCNVIFFFFQAFTGFNSMRTPLQVHLNRMPYSRFIKGKVADAITERGTTFAAYETRFNATIETQAKTLVFLMIPMFALGLEALYLLKKEYFVKHLIFSTHFFGFYLLMLSVTYLGVTVAAMVISRLQGTHRLFIGDVGLTIIVLGAAFVYLLVAVRRVYNQSLLWAGLSTLGLIGVLAVVVQTYRFILFFTAFYSI
ncbi:MAG TPA: DUF3667 domain-containing protein [Pyrinomonadaceae bacterium]